VNELIKQLVPPIVTYLFGAITGSLWEKRKRLRFSADDWKFQYLKIDSAGGWHWDDKTEREITEGKGTASSVRYLFAAKIFNEKSEATGLHKLSVVFMKGEGRQRKKLFEHNEPLDASVPVQPGARSPKLGEIHLPAREFAVEQIVGYPGWNSILSETESIWLFARSPDGKPYSWKVADISHRLGTPRGS
jgi:hypothetical protein